jgi:hypothetical protein
MSWSWCFSVLYTKLALGIPVIALLMVPASLGWAGLSLFLGRQQEKRARALAQSSS